MSPSERERRCTAFLALSRASGKPGPSELSSYCQHLVEEVTQILCRALV